MTTTKQTIGTATTFFLNVHIYAFAFASIKPIVAKTSTQIHYTAEVNQFYMLKRHFVSFKGLNRLYPTVK